MTAQTVLALPTVAEVLALPELRRGRPRVLAGAAGLDRLVRWVHAAEITDIAHLLSGGELLLTTGIALPDDPVQLVSYVDGLAAAGVAAVVVELVRRWPDGPPAALVAAAARHDLPLVTLEREARFVAVTEAVVARIRDAQLAELQAAEHIHRTFTALTISGAEPAEVLHEVAEAAGRPVVLETYAHHTSADPHVLAYDAAGTDPVRMLADWSSRSKAVELGSRTGYDAGSGWLVTVVGARGDDWGRLVLVSPEPPAHRHVVIAERAAATLALNRLAAKERDSLERQTHRTLLTALLSTRRPPDDLAARAAALGVPVTDGLVVGLAARPRIAVATAQALATQEILRDLAEAMARATRRHGAAALVGVTDDTTASALVVVPGADQWDATVERIAADVHREAGRRSTPVPVVIGAGHPGRTLTGAHRTLLEASHVADSALRTGAERSYHRLADARLRGLLHLLRDDDRVLGFAERELAALREDPALLAVLRSLCAHGGNKSGAAAAVHMSRSTFYAQLARIERQLGVPLDDPESVLSLHVALLARDAAAPGS